MARRVLQGPGRIRRCLRALRSRQKRTVRISSTFLPQYSVSDTAQIAAVEANLVLLWNVWVLRRVETIAFLDETTIRRSMSIDFTFPNLPAAVQPFPMPLGLRKKGMLRGFQLYDEEGRVLPLLTRAQSTEMEYHILAGAVQLMLRRRGESGRLDEIRRGLLHSVADGDADASHEAEIKAREAFQLVSVEPTSPDEEQQVNSLLTDVARNVIVFVPLMYEPGRRRVIKMAWEEDVLKPEAFSRRKPLTISVLGLGIAGSYHAEVRAPAELVFDDRSNSEVLHVEIRGHDLFAHAIPTRRGEWGTVACYFKLDPDGIARTASYASVVTSLILIGGLALRFGFQIHPGGTAASAILVALPGIFAAHLLRTGEHGLVERFARIQQLGIFAASMISILAAGCLTLSFPLSPWGPVGWRAVAWIGLTLISLPVTIFLVASIRAWRIITERHVRKMNGAD